MKKSYEIKEIEFQQAKDLILKYHYIKTVPPITISFGLFRDGLLVGCACFGIPFGPSRKSWAGEQNYNNILELNRVVLTDNVKNEASMLIGGALNHLREGMIVVSYADLSQNHLGTVYQAANFKYYGLTKKKKNWKIKGQEHKHGMTIADQSANIEKGSRADYMRETHGENFYTEARPQKHKYAFIVGKKKDYSIISYKEKPFPKAE